MIFPQGEANATSAAGVKPTLGFTPNLSTLSKQASQAAQVAKAASALPPYRDPTKSASMLAAKRAGKSVVLPKYGSMILPASTQAVVNAANVVYAAFADTGLPPFNEINLWVGREYGWKVDPADSKAFWVGQLQKADSDLANAVQKVSQAESQLTAKKTKFLQNVANLQAALNKYWAAEDAFISKNASEAFRYPGSNREVESLRKSGFAPAAADTLIQYAEKGSGQNKLVPAYGTGAFRKVWYGKADKAQFPVELASDTVSNIKNYDLVDVVQDFLYRIARVAQAPGTSTVSQKQVALNLPFLNIAELGNDNPQVSVPVGGKLNFKVSEGGPVYIRATALAALPAAIDAYTRAYASALDLLYGLGIDLQTGKEVPGLIADIIQYGPDSAYVKGAASRRVEALAALSAIESEQTKLKAWIDARISKLLPEVQTVSKDYFAGTISAAQKWVQAKQLVSAIQIPLLVKNDVAFIKQNAEKILGLKEGEATQASQAALDLIYSKIAPAEPKLKALAAQAAGDAEAVSSLSDSLSKFDSVGKMQTALVAAAKQVLSAWSPSKQAIDDALALIGSVKAKYPEGYKFAFADWSPVTEPKKEAEPPPPEEEEPAASPLPLIAAILGAALLFRGR